MGSVIIETSSLKRPYIYPMSNATNGGESHTEYNVRSALSNLLSYSAAFSIDDFEVGGFNYTTNSSGVQGISLYISKGKGNCNSYFVSADEFGNENNPKFIPMPSVEEHIPVPMTSSSSARFGLYVSITYTQNIADGLCYRFICDGFRTSSTDSFLTDGTEYDSIYKSIYKPQGFNDIGIKLGDAIYRDGSFSSFNRNPDITRCMDISRFGNESDFSDKLSQLITRLQVLNVYGGNLYLSNTGIGDNFVSSSEIIDYLGADFRIRLHTEVADYTENGDIINEWDKFKYYVLTDKTKPDAETDNNIIFSRSVYYRPDNADWSAPNLHYRIYRNEPGQNLSTIGSYQNYRFNNNIGEYSNPNITYISYGDIGSETNKAILRGPYKYDTSKHALILQDNYINASGTERTLFLVDNITFSGDVPITFKDPISGVSYNIPNNRDELMSIAYMYTDTNNVVHIVRYIDDKGFEQPWLNYSFKLLDNEVEDISTLDQNMNYILPYPTKNIYFTFSAEEDKMVRLEKSNVTFSEFPVPILSKFYFDGSSRSNFPNGTKILLGDISLVKHNLGGQDDVIFEIAKFSTKPFIVPYTQLDTIGQNLNIEIDDNGLQFIQSISTNFMRAVNIETNEIDTSIIKFDNGTHFQGGTDSLNNPAIVTDNNIVANKIFGAVWM